MIQPLLTSLRTLILPRLVKAMPLKPMREFPLEPEKRPDLPEPDAWLLEKPQTMQAEFDHYVSSFADLAGQLGGLRALASEIAAVAPEVNEVVRDDFINAPVWADADLFDGEPSRDIVEVAQWAASLDDDLFDTDTAEAFDIPVAVHEPRLGLQIPMPEQHHPI